MTLRNVYTTLHCAAHHRCRTGLAETHPNSAVSTSRRTVSPALVPRSEPDRWHTVRPVPKIRSDAEHLDRRSSGGIHHWCRPRCQLDYFTAAGSSCGIATATIEWQRFDDIQWFVHTCLSVLQDTQKFCYFLLQVNTGNSLLAISQRHSQDYTRLTNLAKSTGILAGYVRT